MTTVARKRPKLSPQAKDKFAAKMSDVKFEKKPAPEKKPKQ